MKRVATIKTDFDEKFGIPRQGGIIEELKGQIVFEPEFRNPDVIRGIDEFSHIWLLWEFSENLREGWSATVRPPRLGGNERRGVFATRAPFRPNPIGMTAVKLERVEMSEKLGPVLHVAGADLLNGTPILDIKPYVPYADCLPGASSGFAAAPEEHVLAVRLAVGAGAEAGGDADAVEAGGDGGDGDLVAYFCGCGLAPEQAVALKKVLSLDPRPSYQEDPQRVYGMSFAGFNVEFRVAEGTVLVVGIK